MPLASLPPEPAVCLLSRGGSLIQPRRDGSLQRDNMGRWGFTWMKRLVWLVHVLPPSQHQRQDGAGSPPGSVTRRGELVLAWD